MGQHRFARDREFALVSQTEDTVWFRLEDDEESRRIYPVAFRLEIGYQLLKRGVKVMWKERIRRRKPYILQLERIRRSTV